MFQVLCPVAVDDVPPADDPQRWREHKRAAAERLLPVVEECVPSWAGRIEVVDVSTPRAVERFVRSPGGSCFGVACTVDQSGAPKFPTGFGLRGLVSAGQSVGLPGLYGSIASAFVAAEQAAPRSA